MVEVLLIMVCRLVINNIIVYNGDTMDEMKIIHPITGEDKLNINSNNEVEDIHTCTFADFEDSTTCIYCHITVAEFTAKGIGIPVINPNVRENKE